MQTLTFSLSLSRYGITRWRATVPATPAALIGPYHNGKPYAPLNSAVLERLPFSYRKAFIRVSHWWFDDTNTMRCDLISYNGQPMGTIFASPNF